MKLLINELVPVYETDKGERVVDGRTLHRFLKVGKDFSTWMKDRIEKFDLIEGEEYSPILGKTSANGGRPSLDYILKLDTAKEIAMVENNEQGKLVRKYFIEVEKRFKVQVFKFSLPQTMPEALRMLAAEIEEKAIIAADNQRLSLESAEQKRRLKEQEAPVAIYNLAISAQNTMSMQEVAKSFGTGRTRLYNILREEGIVMKGSTLPYQRYIDSGHFKVVERPRASGETIKNDPATRVYAKGFELIGKIFKKRAEQNAEEK